MSLTVEPEDDETEIFGKEVGDLQDNVMLVGNRIKGTLKFVDDYTGFSGEEELQSGHYLAMKVDDVPEDAITTVQLIGARTTLAPVELDEDMNFVFRISDPDTQKIRIVSEADGYQKFDRTYRLSGLTLEPEE